MIDISRRGFLFGAAATLIVPPKRTIIILPKLEIIRPDKPFDLPMQQMLSLLQKLDDQMIEISAIPRWVVTDKAWYDQVTGNKLPIT
jgi:hypothetical protein